MEKNGAMNQYRKELKPRILEYALKQFMLHGIRSVKMDDLAKDLGVSKRTMYELYENKEAILLEGMKLHQHMMDEKLHTVAEKEGTTVIDILAEFFRIQMFHASKFNPVIFEELTKYPKVQEHIRIQRERISNSASEFFRRGVEEGYFRADIDYALVAKVYIISMDQILIQHLYEEYSMSDLTKNLMFVYLRAFCTIKGLEKLDAMLDI